MLGFLHGLSMKLMMFVDSDDSESGGGSGTTLGQMDEDR